MSFAAALVYSGSPRMERYSWSSPSSFRRTSVACILISQQKNPKKSASCPTFLTTGRTQGLFLSSRYAPTPRLTLFGNVSSLYAAVNLKMLHPIDTLISSVRQKGVFMHTYPEAQGEPPPKVLQRVQDSVSFTFLDSQRTCQPHLH